MSTHDELLVLDGRVRQNFIRLQCETVSAVASCLETGQDTADEHARPAVMVGGLVIHRLNQLVDVVGADAWGADASESVDAASHIAGNRLSGVAS